MHLSTGLLVARLGLGDTDRFSYCVANQFPLTLIGSRGYTHMFVAAIRTTFMGGTITFGAALLGRIIPAVSTGWLVLGGLVVGLAVGVIWVQKNVATPRKAESSLLQWVT